MAQDCSEVKVGEFIPKNPNAKGSILKRTDNTQEEIIESLGVHLKYDLHWIDDCTYALFNGNLIKGNPKFEGNRSDTLFVEITKVTHDGYEFRSTANFTEFGSTGSAKARGSVTEQLMSCLRFTYENEKKVLAAKPFFVGGSDQKNKTLENRIGYYSFGMILPGRSYSGSDDYRFGFNGKEMDDEVHGGNGNQYDYGFRIYNPRIGKFLSVDPLTSSYPWYTPYQFAGNKPIWAIDLDGLEEFLVNTYSFRGEVYLVVVSYIDVESDRAVHEPESYVVIEHEDRKLNKSHSNSQRTHTQYSGNPDRNPQWDAADVRKIGSDPTSVVEAALESFKSEEGEYRTKNGGTDLAFSTYKFVALQFETTTTSIFEEESS